MSISVTDAWEQNHFDITVHPFVGRSVCTSVLGHAGPCSSNHGYRAARSGPVAVTLFKASGLRDGKG